MFKAIGVNRRSNPAGVVITKTSSVSLEKDTDVLVEHLSFGINAQDIIAKNAPQGPNILGYMACGIVKAVGAGVSGFMSGDVVTYFTAPIGAFCTARTLHYKHLIHIPVSLAHKTVSACLFQASFAHALTCRAFVMRPGIWALVHNASSIMGSLLAQFILLHQGNPICVVEENSQIDPLNKLGVKHVVNSENWIHKVKEITDENGINVVYDSIGKKVFAGSVDCLVRFGMLVNYDMAIGSVQDTKLSSLFHKSIYYTAASLFDYKANRTELLLTAMEVFGLLEAKKLTVPYNEFLGFEKFPEAITSFETSSTAAIVAV